MAASPHARIFLIGLWTEADDQGVFEWKPLTLKARILPVDAVDAAALLAEIEAASFILRFEEGGRGYGAIKNFRKFQRPQKPNAVHPLPERLRIYVGLSGSVIVGVTDQSRTGTVNPLQMEDVGCRMDDEADAAASVTRDDWPADWFDLFWERYPNKVGKPKAQSALAAHRKRKTSFSEIMAGLDRYIRDKPPDRAWCNPLTWINQERWTDQPAAVIPLKASKGNLSEAANHGDAIAERLREWEIDGWSHVPAISSG